LRKLKVWGCTALALPAEVEAASYLVGWEPGKGAGASRVKLRGCMAVVLPAEAALAAYLIVWVPGEE
jgi:hypothetical protein